jgi:6-phosphofructokinase 1
MQRGGTPTSHHRNLATVFGARAASLVAENRFGRMVALQDGAFTDVPLSHVADETRTVPLDSPLIASARAVGVSFGVQDLETQRPETDSAGPA